MQAAAALEPAFAAQLSPAELRRAGQVVANLHPNPNPNPNPNPDPNPNPNPNPNPDPDPNQVERAIAADVCYGPGVDTVQA